VKLLKKQFLLATTFLILQTLLTKTNNMKNLFILTILFLTSCVSYVPLTKTYKDSILKESFIKSNTYWDNIIDFFSENGIPIKNMDKQSGLIISDEFYLSNKHITGEDQYGTLINPLAWVVSGYWNNGPYKIGPHGDVIPKCKVTFIVRIREDNNTKILVNFNILDCNNYVNAYGKSFTWEFKDVQSTGVFERDLINRIINTKQ